MYKHCPPGLEVMGWDKLEPQKYMDENKKENVKSCPFRQWCCNKSKCALWNEGKRRCGLIK